MLPHKQHLIEHIIEPLTTISIHCALWYIVFHIRRELPICTSLFLLYTPSLLSAEAGLGSYQQRLAFYP